MKLTTLDIKGFKSFGDKTTIHFDEGVTSIVGPNGCGKSNVVDAIRWVLGEQSTKMLRSEKMENVIFNGTKSRKASNLAEVSLSFDNTKNILPTDYSQVTITRKLYRSGESEYRLNNIQCRLKDITDLFLDTGIGADSYSIIELRMVDELLNNKDNSRRTLFEEASGISKYKIRKKQTFNKLRDTETDLNRVEDLVFEIEKNLKALESQAKKTERYYRIKEQYKEISIDLASFRINNFKISLDELEAQEQQRNDEKLALQTKTDATEAAIQEEKLINLTKEKNLSIQQKATNDFVNGIRQYESDKKLKNEQHRYLSEKETRLELEIANDKQTIDNTQQSIKAFESTLESENSALTRIEINLKSVKTELDALKEKQNSCKTELETLSTQNKNLQNQVFQIEKEKDIIEVQKNALIQELERNTTDTQHKAEEIQDFADNISKIENTLVQKEELLTQTIAQEEILLKKIETAEYQLQLSKEKLIAENRTLDAKINEYNLTKSLVENLEGFPDSIKFLKKNANWAKNAPLLSDVLFCKEEYRISIENYLEPYMNYYVVQSTAEAIAAINLLSSSSKGRANFFILDAFEGAKTTSASSEIPSLQDNRFVSALEITECEDKYRKLCAHLLKNVYLVLRDDENTFLEHSVSDVILLSAGGKFSKAKFSMAGGSVGLFEGKRIGRAKNLEALQRETKKLDEQLLKLKQQVEQQTEQLSKLKNDTKANLISEIRAEVNQLRTNLVGLQSKQEQFKNFIANSNLRKEDIEQKIKSYEEQLVILLPKLTDLTNNLQINSNLLNSLQADYAVLSERVNELSAEYNKQNIGLHQQQNRIAAIHKDVEYKQSQVQLVQARIMNNSQELTSTKAEMQALVLNNQHSDSDLLAMYAQKEQLEKGLQETEEAYYQSRGKINTLEQELTDIRRKKEQAEELILAIKEKKTLLKIDLNALKERLSVEFDIQIEDLLDADLPESQEDELKRKAEKIKEQLENFGAINPLAMEAYNEMHERYQFIQNQKKDLLEAKQVLLQTISEIDETAKTKFLESFAAIRENFVTVFRSLFNEEDSCDLILIDPNDPLDSEIEIIAKPKGKRPLTINQLSGGEKTLTATAILFSLYLLKPAPFCIFDEVDAPLDDTNIDKFNHIIRKFSNDSQFIIVTHNKRTIASTDIVYGVTMIEQGISRVVPVDLRNVELVA